MTSRLLMLTLARSRRPRDGGGFMLACFLIVMAVLLGGLAMAKRSSMAELGSAYQSQARDARAAAVIGMAAVVCELMRHRNRRLLGAGDSGRRRTGDLLQRRVHGADQRRDFLRCDLISRDVCRHNVRSHRYQVIPSFH